ncbi:MAG TPA: hypothetical protein VNB94_05145 [Mycobacteriales bacterium]|nr:hypothetical protein [Mycobacteriales bacterium]
MPRRSRLRPEVLRELDRWLHEHHDVVSVSRLSVLGVPRHHATNRVRDGRWQRIHEGVFYARTGPLGFESRCAAALAVLGPDAALDDETALVAWGLLTAGKGPKIRVVIAHRGSKRAPDSVVVRRRVGFSARSWHERNGLQVLRLEHAVIAMSRRRPGSARGLLSSAVQKGMTTADRLRGAVLAWPSIAGRARLLLLIADIDGGSRSELECAVLDGVRRSDLPIPQRNYALLIEGRRLWLDMCYPALRIAIEIDGKAYHVLAEDWEDDLERQNDIVLDGWLILRFSTRAIREDLPGCVRRIRIALDRRAAELGAAA